MTHKMYSNASEFYAQGCTVLPFRNNVYIFSCSIKSIDLQKKLYKMLTGFAPLENTYRLVFMDEYVLLSNLNNFARHKSLKLFRWKMRKGVYYQLKTQNKMLIVWRRTGKAFSYHWNKHHAISKCKNGCESPVW